MNVYEKVLKALEEDKKVSVDLNGKKILIDKVDITKESTEFLSAENAWEELDTLYQNFKSSIPSGKFRYNYFKAKELEELTTAELAYGEKRYFAKVKLEAFLLCGIMQGLLVWENPNHWFQARQDKDFVLLKKWF